MQVSQVLSLIKDKQLQFADLRFTDTKVKNSTSLCLSVLLMKSSSPKVRCLMAHPLPAGAESISRT